LVLSQLTFGGLLVLCVVLIPRFALEADEGGVSNYGVNDLTVVPFSVAFVLSAALLLRTGRSLRPAVGLRRAGLGFEAVAWLQVLVALSTYPYKLDLVLADVHLGSAILYFGAELALVVWLVLAVSPSRWHTALGAWWFAGLAVTVATLLGFLHVLLVGQAMMATGFAAVTIAVVRAEQQSPRRALPPAAPGDRPAPALRSVPAGRSGRRRR
jgi:hypothetical protein